MASGLLTELKIKDKDGSFSEAYPIGTLAQYVYMNNYEGENAQDAITANAENIATNTENIDNLTNQISSLEEEIDDKADVYHASSKTTYGTGSSSLYGHLKISSIYSAQLSDSGTTALSNLGAYNLYTRLTEVSNIHYYEGQSLDDYSWDDFVAMCNDNDFSQINEGDYKTTSLTTNGVTETVYMEIAGIDTYWETSGYDDDHPRIKHHIDWISRDCLKEKYYWNVLEANNNGNSSYPQPYFASDVFYDLNNTIYPNLEKDLKSVISNKVTLLEQRYSASTPLTSSTTWSWESLGKLWLPSEFEILGAQILGTPKWGSGQCAQYPLFNNGWRHRLKKLGTDGDYTDWWLITPADGSSKQICGVSATGAFTSHNADGAYAIPLCFRIEASK